MTTISTTTASAAADIDAATNLPEITDRVYFDIALGTNPPQPLGRLELGLFGTFMPRSTQHFVRLCRDDAYAGSTFYRVLSGYNVQAGAIANYGDKYRSIEPERYDLRHSTAGLVSWVRNVNGSAAADSRIVVNTQDDAGWADDRYAAFGIVLHDGLTNLIRQRIEPVPVQRPQNKPKVDVTIVQSGVLSWP